MNSDFLPKWATPTEACEWLQKRTGQPWPLVRLLEAPLCPHIWLTPDAQEPPGEAVMERLFGGRHEGFLAPVLFVGDTHRLAVERRGGLSATRGPTGDLFRFTPPVPFELDELRFKADELRALAAYTMHGKPEGATKGKPLLKVGDVTIAADDALLGQWLELHGGPGQIKALEVLRFVAPPELQPGAKAPPANAAPVLQPEGHARAEREAQPESAGPAPAKKWTAQRLAELAACREAHGTKAAAERFGISPARVRELLPGEKPARPAKKAYSVFTHRAK